MPKGSQELTNARKDEIINACEKLYQTMNFRDITIKEIGNVFYEDVGIQLFSHQGGDLSRSYAEGI